MVSNAGKLDFPFRRYQIQKAWRGERPQEGRFREFTQADIDIVDADSLAFHHEVEVALVMAELLARLPIPQAVIQLNNRKLVEGFYLGLGIDDTAAVLRTIDKLDKLGEERTRRVLVDEVGLAPATADACLALAGIRSADGSFVERVRALGVSHPLLDEGLDELASLLASVNRRQPGAAVADLRIARGLDYYTGTIYETELLGYESVGSICSGGRYDSLASEGKKTYPGVGISLGVTRLMSVLVGNGLASADRSVPTVVLVAVNDEASRPASEDVADRLRARGIACEVAPRADKFGKQIKYADRRGIPYVWFPDEDGHTVKDIRSGEQAVEQLAAVVALEVDGDAALAAIAAGEVDRLAIDKRRPLAHFVAARRLDLDDIGAELGEQPGGKRPRDQLAQFENTKTIQCHRRGGFGSG